MPVGHVPLISLLALEENLTFLTAEEADIMHLVFVSVPVGPGLGHLPAQLARAAPVVVDDVIQRNVAPSHLLLLRDDQSPVYIRVEESVVDLDLERAERLARNLLQQARLQLHLVCGGGQRRLLQLQPAARRQRQVVQRHPRLQLERLDGDRPVVNHGGGGGLPAAAPPAGGAAVDVECAGVEELDHVRLAGHEGDPWAGWGGLLVRVSQLGLVVSVLYLKELLHVKVNLFVKIV